MNDLPEEGPEAPEGPFVSAPTAAPPPSSTPPGWYPVEGGQRFWDGNQWTDHAVAHPTGPSNLAPAPGQAMSENDQRQMAMFAHLGQLAGLISGIGGFVVPLVIMLTKGKESEFVRRAAVESINFWITGIIAAIIAFISLIVVVGLVLLPLVMLIWFVMPIYAGIKANDGEDYRYPFCLRILS